METEQNPLRVGLVGYGAIGQDVARLVAERAAGEIAFIGALVRHPTVMRPPGSPTLVTTCAALLAEQPDVVVEVAGHEGLRESVRLAVELDSLR